MHTGESGSPVRINVIGAHGTMGPMGPTAGGRRADRRQINLTSNVKNTNLGPIELLGPKRPVASGGGRRDFDLYCKGHQFDPLNRRK